MAISGFGEPVLGEIPLIKVRRASAGRILGCDRGGRQALCPDRKADPGSGWDGDQAGDLFEEAAVQPGEYLTVVTLGAYKAVKVDASYGAVLPGSLLVASPNPGYAMVAENPKPGTIVGKALGPLASGVGHHPGRDHAAVRGAS